MPSTPRGMVSSAYLYSSSTAFWNKVLISALNSGRPQSWVFQLQLVDQVDAEVAVHRLIAQDVLVLLSRTGHLVLPTQRQNLGEADVEEQAFHQAGKHDQGLQQGLIGLVGASVEVRVA